MKKSIIIFSAICLMFIAYIIGVKVGRNEAIHNARLVSNDGNTYVIGYGYNGEECDEECHEYRRADASQYIREEDEEADE